MKTNFRIRRVYTDNESEYKKSQKAYLKHLGRFNKTSNTDLWKFFYWDFFHDGWIENIAISDDLKTVTMKINGPNIRRLLPKGDYEYLNASFTCTFIDVVGFEIKNESPGEWSNNPAHPATFLYAEINTSPLLAKLKNKDEFYSLLILTDIAGDNALLEIVFSQVNVEPDEPLAFSLMESDKRFTVPVFRPKKK